MAKMDWEAANQRQRAWTESDGMQPAEEFDRDHFRRASMAEPSRAQMRSSRSAEIEKRKWQERKAKQLEIGKAWERPKSKGRRGVKLVRGPGNKKVFVPRYIRTRSELAVQEATVAAARTAIERIRADIGGSGPLVTARVADELKMTVDEYETLRAGLRGAKQGPEIVELIERAARSPYAPRAQDSSTNRPNKGAKKRNPAKKRSFVSKQMQGGVKRGRNSLVDRQMPKGVVSSRGKRRSE